ncbi:hypothetical protein [Halorussus amylolyticus]|uniref:hypothetical protein n=1 Tax=Halorussus amylolyticus TaxID=1126242 RepID=UPI0010538CDB|nr:hypothetical protein [Halorussus amylolyticus]
MCHERVVRLRTSGRAAESDREDETPTDRETETERERRGPTGPVALVGGRLAPFVASKLAERDDERGEKDERRETPISR